jgi:hypothetical protein
MAVVFDSSSSEGFFDETVSHAVVDLFDSDDDEVKKPGGSRLGRIKS